MARLAVLQVRASLALVLALCAWDAAHAQIFRDDFESGTADTNISITAPSPWRVNDISTSVYRSTNNPFPKGTLYAELTDPGTGTDPSQATRLLSSNTADSAGYSPLIANMVTTFSFDFVEPSAGEVIDTQPGLGFGYYRLGAMDLNAGGRIFRGFMHNGLLSPDPVTPLGGAAVAYEKDKVNTVFMVANDTADQTLTNYRDTQTLAPQTADVWISLAGAAPAYAFTVPRQNVGMTLGGFGFRSFNPDTEQFFIDNVLTLAGASFDRSTFDAPVGKLGDYNGDLKVDGADFLVWQRTLGAAAGAKPNADGSGNGTVDAADLGVWRQHFGEASSAAAAGVPEPGAMAMLLPLAGLALRLRRVRPGVASPG